MSEVCPNVPANPFLGQGYCIRYFKNLLILRILQKIFFFSLSFSLKLFSLKNEDVEED